ncbi:MAG: hypothetical protein U9Q94_05685 [Candidatus Bipolaricaulota bacterium]|nr:hypothetical protein [Candidatus Bipolaricaulota bacterium]
MKKALVITIVGIALSVLFLAVGYAQGDATAMAAQDDLLQQELAQLGEAFAGVNNAFGGLQTFMNEVVGEVKGNMADVAGLDSRLGDLSDVVQAISVELKTAEGKLIGLRKDVDGLSSTQQELLVRATALESGLSELSASCDEFQKAISASLDATNADLSALSDKYDALAVSFADFDAQFASFKDSVIAELASIEGAISTLQSGVSGLSDKYDGLALSFATSSDQLAALAKGQAGLEGRMKKLEDEDVGTFKKKVIELERSMSALSIKIDNNRAKLEGFDGAIADLANGVSMNQAGILANTNLIEDHDARIAALEGGAGLAELKSQVDGLYFISIVALLAGVGALIWGFMAQP